MTIILHRAGCPLKDGNSEMEAAVVEAIKIQNSRDAKQKSNQEFL
jgi:hypothetical protein